MMERSGTAGSGGRRLLCVLAVGMLALATVLSGAAWGARMRPVRPALRLSGASSPFRLAHSAAHGIVPRRRAAAAGPWSFPHASAFAGGVCEASCGSQPLEYHGGEVMHKVKLYLIDWEPSEPSKNGQPGTTFTALPAGYMTSIEQFLQRVAVESGAFNNVYSVDRLYGDSTAGEYQVEFGQSFRDEEPYPARLTSTCPMPTTGEERYPPSGQPCISDAESATGEKNYQLAEGLFDFLHKHPSLPRGLKAIYFVLTPQGVNSCAGSEEGTVACNTNFYCAYHSAFNIESSGVSTPVVYANMPYDDVEGCRTPSQPNGAPADDEINIISHEDNEAVTDPLGNAWFDHSGYEVADKCDYPFFDASEDANPSTDAYGPLLGGSSGTSAYNQEIDGGHYLLQREWSNAAGGCVTRAPRVGSSFVVSQAAARTFSFNGSPSSTEAGAITRYTWSFGDGSPSASGREVEHAYKEAGTYQVTLEVESNSDLTASDTQSIDVTGEPAGTTTLTSTTTATSTQPVTSTTLATTSVTTTRTVTSAAPEAPGVHYSAVEMARLLGLPAGGSRLSGLGRISLGHAQCPPACGLKASLVAIVDDGTGRKRHLRRIAIGHLKETIALKGTGLIALRLTGAGRRLLQRMHALHVRLIVTVQDREGASWQIARRLTLTSGARSARRHRRRPRARRGALRHNLPRGTRALSQDRPDPRVPGG